MLDSELNEYKDTTALLSQAQVRLTSIVHEVEKVAALIRVAQEREEKRQKLDQEASQALVVTMAGVFAESLTEPLELAREAYWRYGNTVDFKNFMGNPMPTFDELPPAIQQAWVAAANG